MAANHQFQPGTCAPIDKDSARANAGTFFVIESVDNPAANNKAKAHVVSDEASARLLARDYGRESRGRMADSEQSERDAADAAIVSTIEECTVGTSWGITSKWRDLMVAPTHACTDLVGKTIRVVNLAVSTKDGGALGLHTGEVSFSNAEGDSIDLDITFKGRAVTMAICEEMARQLVHMEPAFSEPITITSASQLRAFKLIKHLPLSRGFDSGAALDATDIINVLKGAQVPCTISIGDPGLEHSLPAMLAALDMLLVGDGFATRTWPTEKASALGAAMRNFHGASPMDVDADAPQEHPLAKCLLSVFEGKQDQCHAFINKSVEITTDSAAEASLCKGEHFLAVAALDAFLGARGSNADKQAIGRFKTSMGSSPDSLVPRCLLWIIQLQKGKQSAPKEVDTSMLPDNRHSGTPDFAGDESERRARSTLRADAVAVAQSTNAQLRLTELVELCDEPAKLQLQLEKEDNLALRRLLRSGDDIEKALHGMHASASPHHTRKPHSPTLGTTR